MLLKILSIIVLYTIANIPTIKDFFKYRNKNYVNSLAGVDIICQLYYIFIDFIVCGLIITLCTTTPPPYSLTDAYITLFGIAVTTGLIACLSFTTDKLKGISYRFEMFFIYSLISFGLIILVTLFQRLDIYITFLKS